MENPEDKMLMLIIVDTHLVFTLVQISLISKTDSMRLFQS